MTLAARKVLDDCLEAVSEIRDGVQGSQWRIRWVAALVLLRTVGYVLAKVDTKIDEKYKCAIERSWKELSSTKPKPEIFWGFIDAERHNIVHEYEVSAGQGVTVYPGQNRESDYHYTINAGPYAGRDQREVLLEAIKWWEHYLNAIDLAAKT